MKYPKLARRKKDPIIDEADEVDCVPTTNWTLEKHVPMARLHLDSREATDPFKDWAGLMHDILLTTIDSVLEQIGHQRVGADLDGIIQVFLSFQ